MKIIDEIKKRASKVKATIIVPEANIDKRVYDACKSILDNKISKLIVFGKEDEFDDSFKTKNCQIIDIAEFKDLNKFARDLYE